LIDQIVWTEVTRLLEDPTLIQQELDRRLLAARSSDPTKKREQSLQRELIRIGNNIERLLTAYQEDLLSLDQLRERMPSLRQREQALRTELQAIADQANDRANFLRLAETLSAFLVRLRSVATTLDVIERQRIVRLVVKEILIGDDSIVIHHCIPVGLSSPPDGGSRTSGGGRQVPNGGNYLLRSGSNHRPLRGTDLTRTPLSIVHHTGLQPLANQADHARIGDPVFNETDEPLVTHRIEKCSDVDIYNPVHRRLGNPDSECVQRIVLAALGPEPIRET
jgi:site-specific DNA recombinase